MIDEEITSLREDAGYRFAPEAVRYHVVLGATSADEVEHSSEYVADELGIPLDDLVRWEDERLAEQGLAREDPEASTPQAE